MKRNIARTPGTSKLNGEKEEIILLREILKELKKLNENLSNN